LPQAKTRPFADAWPLCKFRYHFLLPQASTNPLITALRRQLQEAKLAHHEVAATASRAAELEREAARAERDQALADANAKAIAVRAAEVQCADAEAGRASAERRAAAAEAELQHLRTVAAAAPPAGDLPGTSLLDLYKYTTF